ncbi:hypothetical protein G9A89_021971 [Geosiphon pyriformis]|nr:hypothetical protein G9A89_021971 [Geosiphon pyriformis]
MSTHLLDIEQKLLQEVQVLIKHVNINKLLAIDFINIDKFEPLFTYISEDEIVDLINNKYNENSNANKDLESEDENEPLPLLSIHQDKTALENTLCYCKEQYSKKVDSDFFKTLRTLIRNTVLKVQEEKKQLNSYFVSKNGHAESRAELSSFFAASTFVDDTIWVGSSQMVILINSRVSNSFLSINSLLIFITKKSELHWYLSIFFLTEGLSKPSLVKVNLDIWFFTNLVLRKAVSDKQLLYLVLAVLHSIVSYRTQFSFVSVEVCNRWDAFILIRFTIFSFMSESKVVSLISFANSGGVVGHLFSYRSYDLQVLCWCPVYSLSFSVRICVSISNNFLADMICVLFDCNLSLGGSLAISFRFYNGVPMSTVLGESKFLRFLFFLKQHSVVFVDQFHDHHSAKRLDPHGPVPKWFKLSVVFLDDMSLFSAISSVLHGVGLLNILESSNFVSVCDHLLQAGTGSLSVYTDGSLSNLGTASCRAGAVTYFENIGLGLGVSVLDLMSSTLAKLQAIALAFECVLSSSFVQLFSDSQSALNACKSELSLVSSDFHNQCWVEHHHIVNVICSKNLKISWHKVKSHFGISENKCTDAITSTASFSDWCLPPHLDKHFLTTDSNIVFGNSRHFVRDVYHSVCHTHWEVGSGSKFLAGSLLSEVNWFHLSLVFISKPLADAHTYFIKALHYWLLIAVQKCLYNKLYSSVLCLYCGEMEKVVSGLSHSSLDVLQLLSSYVSDFSVFTAFHKDFVFDDWFCEAVSIFYNLKVASSEIVKFVHFLGLAFRTGIWSVRAKHCAYMEKNKLIPLDSLAVSVSVIKLLGITDAVGVCFGFYKFCLFFSGIGNLVSVHIAM